MQRVSIEELHKFWETQNIPKVEHFLDTELGRPDIWNIAIKEASKIDGLYCEFGSGMYTTPKLAKLIPNNILFTFDSFEGLKYEDFSETHKQGQWIQDNAEEKLRQISNVTVIKGWYQDTLESFFKENDTKISFIHMDCCIGSSTKYIFDTLIKYDKLQVGTVFMFNNIFYYENNYWYNSDFLLFNDMIKNNNMKMEYLAWAGFCHCAYKIMEIN